MAGAGDSNPPPIWLLVITLAVFMGFVLTFGDTLPTLTGSGGFACSSGALYLDCVTSSFTFAFNLVTLLLDILTLGGFASPLPALIQVPLVFFFALSWGIIIVKMIQNTAGAVIP